MPYKSAPRHISSAFCRLGFPCGSWPSSSRSRSRCSAGLPPRSLTRTATPSRMPTMPSWEMGFCSKNSRTKAAAYRSVRRYRVGSMSLSAMANDMSSTSTRCRMMPRCSGVVSRRSRRRFSASSVVKSSVPSSPSSGRSVSHVRFDCSHACAVFFLRPPLSFLPRFGRPPPDLPPDREGRPPPPPPAEAWW